jgi:HAD superfamily hydrolase (TIGR01509 family)
VRTAPPARAVVFDFDGVIVTGSNEAYFPVYHAALEAVGHRMPPEEERSLILQYWSWPSAFFFRHLFPDDEARAQRATEVYREALFSPAFLSALKISGELRDSLGRLAASGFGLGIVSGANPKLIAGTLLHHRLDGLFPHVLSGYDFAPEHQKPSPHMLLVAAERLGCAPGRCIYVGDADTDLGAARSAGMPFCAVLTGNLTRAEAARLGADWIVDTAADVESVARQHLGETAGQTG